MKDPIPPTDQLVFWTLFFPQTPLKALLFLIKDTMVQEAYLHLWYLQNLYHKNTYVDLQEWKENLWNHCYCFFHGTDH